MIRVFAFCAFVVAAVWCFLKRDVGHGCGWTGLALLNLPG